MSSYLTEIQLESSKSNINQQFKPFDTGIPDLDELLEVLLSTSMFTSGILGCLFDNILPGMLHSLCFLVALNITEKGRQQLFS